MAQALLLQLLALCKPPFPPGVGEADGKGGSGDLQGDQALAAPPRPWLEAQPAAIVTPGINVTLKCLAPQPAWRFELFKLGEETPRFLQAVSSELAEFFLEEVMPTQGGRYLCRYGSPAWGPGLWSQPSEALELLVTDQLPKPLLVALPGPVLPPGANVSLRCTSHMAGMSFALYRIDMAAPLQYQDSARCWADFPLSAAHAPGTYSCYYHTPTEPYVLSQRSELLVITSQGSASSDHTKENSVRLVLAGLVLLALGTLLALRWRGRNSALRGVPPGGACVDLRCKD
ncbi:LOW QUALITY PROTEIN: osteoclast-associated immunoglobulin-like receptor [Thomomys bottae]